jgi:uncharacterized protein YcbK (DUF882 family)
LGSFGHVTPRYEKLDLGIARLTRSQLLTGTFARSSACIAALAFAASLVTGCSGTAGGGDPIQLAMAPSAPLAAPQVSFAGNANPGVPPVYPVARTDRDPQAQQVALAAPADSSLTETADPALTALADPATGVTAPAVLATETQVAALPAPALPVAPPAAVVEEAPTVVTAATVQPNDTLPTPEAVALVEAPVEMPVVAEAPKNNGFLGGLFGNRKPPAAIGEKPVQVASLEPQAAVNPARRTIITKTAGTERASMAVLPGVRGDDLFEIKKRSSLADLADEEENDVPAVRVASAAGLARLTPSGIRTQTDKVDVGCFKPELVRMIKTIEKKYGRPAIVTSGYRSPTYNRRIRGAKNSLHMYCSAADIQLEGVSKWQLAQYVRTMPGRGGVGTYCHTESVHVDIGPERDWNWRCRRRK